MSNELAELFVFSSIKATFSVTRLSLVLMLTPVALIVFRETMVTLRWPPDKKPKVLIAT